jgi:hypothetical protein
MAIRPFQFTASQGAAKRGTTRHHSVHESPGAWTRGDRSARLALSATGVARRAPFAAWDATPAAPSGYIDGL